MNIRELITELEEIADSAAEGDDLKVMIATQPNWPLQAEIACVSYVDGRLYIAEGYAPYDSPYAPRAAWEARNADQDEDWGD